MRSESKPSAPKEWLGSISGTVGHLLEGFVALDSDVLPSILQLTHGVQRLAIQRAQPAREGNSLCVCVCVCVASMKQVRVVVML